MIYHQHYITYFCKLTGLEAFLFCNYTTIKFTLALLLFLAQRERERATLSLYNSQISLTKMSILRFRQISLLSCITFHICFYFQQQMKTKSHKYGKTKTRQAIGTLSRFTMDNIKNSKQFMCSKAESLEFKGATAQKLSLNLWIRIEETITKRLDSNQKLFQDRILQKWTMNHV